MVTLPDMPAKTILVGGELAQCSGASVVRQTKQRTTGHQNEDKVEESKCS